MCMSSKVMWVTLKKPRRLLLERRDLPCEPCSRTSYGRKSCPCQSFTTAWLVVSSGWPCIPKPRFGNSVFDNESGSWWVVLSCILPVLRLPQILRMPKVGIFWVEHTWLVKSTTRRTNKLFTEMVTTQHFGDWLVFSWVFYIFGSISIAMRWTHIHGLFTSIHIYWRSYYF